MASDMLDDKELGANLLLYQVKSANRNPMNKIQFCTKVAGFRNGTAKLSSRIVRNPVCTTLFQQTDSPFYRFRIRRTLNY